MKSKTLICGIRTTPELFLINFSIDLIFFIKDSKKNGDFKGDSKIDIYINSF